MTTATTNNNNSPTLTPNEPPKAQTPTRMEAAPVQVPRVDLLADRERIRLLAEMPGVEQQAVSVTVDHRVLTIEGRTGLADPEGYEPAFREFGSATFRREFSLADLVDIEGIQARVRHGLLDVTLPKRPEARVRKIEITS